MTSRQPAYPAATIVLGAVALSLFALLTLRHVGESYFLADQVDQLQKYEAALRLEPEGLWGPAMSGTAARALGPLGALVFGLPVSLGFGIDAIHVLTSLLLAMATGIAFWQLARLDQVMAWGWLMVFTAMRMVWWNAAMLWVNTLLLPLGLLMLALFTAHLRHPSTAKVAGIALVLLLALQVHLAALVGLPILLIAVGIAPRNKRLGIASVSVLGLIGIALLPYLLAEAKTNFRNTRAVFSHVEGAAQSGGSHGAHAAVETLVLAADPIVLFPDTQTMALTAGGAVALAAIAVLAWKRRRASLADLTAAAGLASLGESLRSLWRRRKVGPDEARERRSPASAMAWLVMSSVIVVFGQALFFLLMARPLNGLHYAILLAPWYAIPTAALLAAALVGVRHPAARLAAPAAGVAAVLVLLALAPARADRFAERTQWNYRAIVSALDTLCDGQTVETLEGPGLVNELTPSYDSVLRFIMKRGLSRCHYDAASDIVIAANRGASFDESIEIRGQQFLRETVLPPGLARYRHLPEPEQRDLHTNPATPR